MDDMAFSLRLVYAVLFQGSFQFDWFLFVSTFQDCLLSIHVLQPGTCRTYRGYGACSMGTALKCCASNTLRVRLSLPRLVFALTTVGMLVVEGIDP